MQQAFLFWYRQAPERFYRAYLGSLSAFEGHFAVRATLAHLTEPVFQDFTWQGRIIGFFLRLARIGAGLLSYCLTSVVYAVAFLVWLLFPIICLLSIVGGIV